DCTDTLQPFARLFSLSKFIVIYVHYFSPCVCAFPYFTNRVGESDLFLAKGYSSESQGKHLSFKKAVNLQKNMQPDKPTAYLEF
ncbi:MAG: hypothetical protein ACI4F5_02610, partial [Acutalibacteraceae bacterium]